MRQPNTLLLFPGPGAVDITDITSGETGSSYNLILLDGTWAQAKNMYLSNKLMELPKKV
jgi:DTW domain-containing protein YfiP